MISFQARPTQRTHDRLWMYCALDPESVRQRMGGRWELFKAYNVDRARTPNVRDALGARMDVFGLPAIPSAELARIVLPMPLIWGRHDHATRLPLAEAASARYGWPLQVIEHAADDPPIEQPEAFVRALRAALGSSLPLEQRSKP